MDVTGAVAGGSCGLPVKSKSCVAGGGKNALIDLRGAPH